MPGPRMKRRMWDAAPLAALLFCLPVAAHADSEAARRGAAVVETWCRDCHPRSGQDQGRFDAPPYEEIVTWPGRDAAYFKKFFAEDHFPMPTFRLFDHEKADVVAYLLSLQEKGR